MCLDVDFDDWRAIGDGTRTARKTHKCSECHRQINPGESYRYWTGIGEYGGGPETFKMCAHCNATIDLGAVLTGCPKQWYWESVHSLDGDAGGFVGDILVNHDLSFADEFRMLRRVVECRKNWRRPNGELYPLPNIPVPA